jgi:hypothetical protein
MTNKDAFEEKKFPEWAWNHSLFLHPYDPADHWDESRFGIS